MDLIINLELKANLKEDVKAMLSTMQQEEISRMLKTIEENLCKHLAEDFQTGELENIEVTAIAEIEKEGAKDGN